MSHEQDRPPVEKVIFILMSAGMDESSASKVALQQCGATERFVRDVVRCSGSQTHLHDPLRHRVLRQKCHDEIQTHLRTPQPGWTAQRVVDTIAEALRSGEAMLLPAIENFVPRPTAGQSLPAA